MSKISRRPPTKPKPTAAKPAQKSGRRPAASQPRDNAAKKAAAKSGPARAAKKSVRAPRPWTSAEVHEAFSRFRKANPEPKGELEHLNPYTLLVAVVLSAQGHADGV